MLLHGGGSGSEVVAVDIARTWRCLQVKMRCQVETSLKCVVNVFA